MSPCGIELIFCAWKLRPGFPLNVFCDLLQPAIKYIPVVGIPLRDLCCLKWMFNFSSSVSYAHEKLAILMSCHREIPD